MILLKAYRIFNALSLDVALGACITSMFIASYIQVSLSVATILSLGISVWLIYTADHLMDAKQITHQPHTFRHYFHQRHFKFITSIAGAVGLFQLLLLFYLPLNTLLGGLLLLFVVGLYFLLLWLMRFKKVYHKEILIALVYACGVFLPPFSISEGALDITIGLLFFQIVLLALSNLLIFSLLEIGSDQKDQQTSLAILLGNTATKRLVFGLLIFGVLLSISLFFSASAQSMAVAEITLFMMNSVLGLILLFPSWRKNDNYRLIGDAVFYIPIVFILLV